MAVKGLIELYKVSKSYGAIEVLKDINLTVREGRAEAKGSA